MANQRNTRAYRVVKRILDCILCLIALPFFCIIFIICAPIIKLTDGGPIFYNAPRVGKGGREYKMYKFRSMMVNAPDLKMEDGSTYSATDDPRVTKIGHFMRRTSFDETPQIFNIFKGDMALIGPRPDVKEETLLYEGDEARKQEVLPGITGYAQVYGRNSIPWKERLKLDVYYVDHCSLGLDAKIFFKTIVQVFKRDDLYASDEGQEAEAR